MAQIDLDSIYKALRVVPDFDGNPNTLTRFIRLCDQLVLTYVSNSPGAELTNLALLNGILNKVTGPAARTINTNCIPENWNGIRSALINNFSDQRDETALYNDLALLAQGSSTPQEFYERCQTLFSTIMTYVTLHETLWRPAPFNNLAPRMTSRTQQIFRATPPNYNPQSNVFKLPNRNPNQGPKPMSGVSHFVTRALPPTPNNNPNWPTFRNTVPNQFRAHEINLNDCFDYYNPYDSVHYYGVPEFYEPMLTYPDNTDYNYYDYTAYETIDNVAAPPSNLNHDSHVETNQTPADSQNNSDSFFQKDPKSKKSK